MSDTKTLDVVAVSDDNKVLWVDGPYDEPNAEAVINMAIMRQGVEDRFFAARPHGQHKTGDNYTA